MHIYIISKQKHFWINVSLFCHHNRLIHFSHVCMYLFSVGQMVLLAVLV